MEERTSANVRFDNHSFIFVFLSCFFSQRFFCRHPSSLALHQIERMESFFHPAHLELSDE